jgi:RimJ/RimL family protein N-acetyltransferase
MEGAGNAQDLFPAGRPAEVADAPIPVPGSGQLLVRTEAVGVGVGLVRMLRAGAAVRPGGEMVGTAVAAARPDLVTQRRTELWDLLAAGRLNPKFQGRGAAKTAVRMLSRSRARRRALGAGARAFPAITNVASNGVCRSAGFRFLEEQETTFARRMFCTNHWVINPVPNLTSANVRIS